MLQAPGVGAALRLEDVPEPRPGPGQVLIAVEACGVCRTDLHILDGDVRSKLPLVPGHQVAGRIVELGAGVEGFTTGDLVGVGWIFSTCGACRFCTSGRENLCDRAPRFTGRDVDGGYAERMIADARYAYPLPAGFTAVDAAPLLCAGIIGYRSLRLSGIQPGGRLALVGFGASAHLAAQVALHWGCEVYAFTREEVHRRLAMEIGATWAGQAWDDPGVPMDAAVIFAPAGELVPAALAAVAKGGVVVCAGIHMSDIPPFPYELLWGERTLRSVANLTRRDGVEFLALAPRVPVRTRVETFPLEQAGDALAKLRAGDVRGALVLVP